MSEPEGQGMSVRVAAIKAALISLEKELKNAEAHVESLRKEQAELRKEVEESATPTQ
jgi:hypothetical protein